MNKSIFVVIVMMLTMSGTAVFAAEDIAKSNTEMLAVPMSENRVMENEISNMNKRLEEIRDMDISELSAKEKKELRKELKKKKKGGAIYIGGSTLLLVILLMVLLV